MICTLAAIVLTLFFKGEKLVSFVLPYIFGFIYVLIYLVLNPKVIITNNVLTYSYAWVNKSVNLAKLTNCNYRIELYVKGMPQMVFHLYDADGGSVTFPANWWMNRKKLYEILEKSVASKSLALNPKTAKKIGAGLTQKPSAVGGD